MGRQVEFVNRKSCRCGRYPLQTGHWPQAHPTTALADFMAVEVLPRVFEVVGKPPLRLRVVKWPE